MNIHWLRLRNYIDAVQCLSGFLPIYISKRGLTITVIAKGEEGLHSFTFELPDEYEAKKLYDHVKQSYLFQERTSNLKGG